MAFEKSKEASSEFCRGKEKDSKIKTGRKRVGGAEETTCLLKKKAVKAAKKEADKDGRDEAKKEEEEEDVDISKVGVLTSATGKNGNKCLIDFRNCYIRFVFFHF